MSHVVRLLTCADIAGSCSDCAQEEGCVYVMEDYDGYAYSYCTSPTLNPYACGDTAYYYTSPPECFYDAFECPGYVPPAGHSGELSTSTRLWRQRV